MRSISAFRSRLAHDGPWLLVLAFLVLLPTKSGFHVPVLLMSVGGAVVMLRDAAAARADPAIKMVWLLFLSLWLPMVASLPDAVNFSRSGLNTLAYPRFLFMGIFTVWALRRAEARRRLLIGLFWVLLLWCADAIWQWIHGRDLFGYPLHPTRLQGIFYPRYRLGIVLAALAPWYFEAVRRLAVRIPAGWTLALPLVLVVVLNGSRAGWISLAAAVSGYLAYRIAAARTSVLTRRNLVRAVVLAGATGVLAWQYPGVGARLEAAQGLIGGDVERLDVATTRRISIWKPAVAMARAHWFNGIGPRGFRYLFAEFAGPGNFWLRPGYNGVTHPHLQWLEVAVETGAVGVLGLGLFFVVLFRSAWRLPGGKRALVMPALLAVGLAVFPLNAHKAFYGSFWASLTWWVIALFAAVYGGAARPAEEEPATARGSPR